MVNPCISPSSIPPSISPSIDTQFCVPQIEEKYKSITVKDESPALKRKINELTVVRQAPGRFCRLRGSSVPDDCVPPPPPPQENQRLKQELMKSQTTVACLHSEMDSLKTDLTDQSISSER